MTTAALDLTHTPAAVPRVSGGAWANLQSMRADPLGLLVRARRECGDLADLRFGPVRTLVLSAPRHVDHLLVRHVSRWGKDTRGQQVLRAVLGHGLLTAEGDTWRRNRRIANPAFTRRAIQGFANTFQVEAQALADRWLEQADGRTEVDVAADMNHLALRLAGLTLFGQDTEAIEQIVGRSLDVVLGEFFRIITLPHPVLRHLPTPGNLRLRRAIADLDEVVAGVITERRSHEPRPDLLGMLMAAEDDEGQRLSDAQLRDEVLTMLLAGHETTANALAWTLYLLGLHPEVQDAVYTEVREAPAAAPGRPGKGPPSLLRQVTLESMRLYPPAWITSRAATEDDVIDGVPVPKGTFAFVSPYLLHRHPELWPDAEAFLPSRWATGQPLGHLGQPVPRNAFLPFGAGQRKCIGSHFADLELDVLLRTLLGSVRLSLVPGHAVGPQASITLRPEHGVLATLRPRC